jgi:hypothetical protein
MPLELGLFLGASRFGQGKTKKITLIVDSGPHRYQIFCSDMSGQDIRVHKKDPVEAIKVVRDWLRANRRDVKIPGGTVIAGRYKEFTEELPELKEEMQLGEDKLTFADYISVLRNSTCRVTSFVTGLKWAFYEETASIAPCGTRTHDRRIRNRCLRRLVKVVSNECFYLC